MTTPLRRFWNGGSHRTATRKRTHAIRMNLESLEMREVPAALSDNGVSEPTYNGVSTSTVSLFNAETTAPLVSMVAPFAGYFGPLVTAAADVSGDGTSDVIAAAPGSEGHVVVIDGKTGATLFSFLAFPGFKGTVNVGAADVNGDGYQDILVSADAPNAPVKAFSGKDASLLSSFYAFPGFNGQLSVSGGNFNGSVDQIIVGAGGPDIGGRVALFNADGTMFNAGFFAFPGFGGSISVAGGDVDGDGHADVVVGAGPGPAGAPIKAFSSIGWATIDSFYSFGTTVTNGANVRVADGNGDGVRDIFVTLQGGGLASLGGYEPLVGFSGKTGQVLAQSTGGEGTNSGGDTGGFGDGGDDSF